MARKCQITGRTALNGNMVSHAHNLTKTRHELNLITRNIWVPERNRWVKVKLSMRALKTLKRKGAAAVLSRAGLI